MTFFCFLTLTGQDKNRWGKAIRILLLQIDDLTQTLLCDRAVHHVRTTTYHVTLISNLFSAVRFTDNNYYMRQHVYCVIVHLTWVDRGKIHVITSNHRWLTRFERNTCVGFFVQIYHKNVQFILALLSFFIVLFCGGSLFFPNSVAYAHGSCWLAIITRGSSVLRSGRPRTRNNGGYK